VSAEECYNLRHAELRNVVERIIGVLKWRFWILVVPPKYGMDIQACLPPALCCIHNIIRKHDPMELDDIEAAVVVVPPHESEGTIGSIADGVPTSADRDRCRG